MNDRLVAMTSFAPAIAMPWCTWKAAISKASTVRFNRQVSRALESQNEDRLTRLGTVGSRKFVGVAKTTEDLSSRTLDRNEPTAGFVKRDGIPTRWNLRGGFCRLEELKLELLAADSQLCLKVGAVLGSRRWILFPLRKHEAFAAERQCCASKIEGGKLGQFFCFRAALLCLVVASCRFHSFRCRTRPGLDFFCSRFRPLRVFGRQLWPVSPREVREIGRPRAGREVLRLILRCLRESFTLLLALRLELVNVLTSELVLVELARVVRSSCRRLQSDERFQVQIGDEARLGQLRDERLELSGERGHLRQVFFLLGAAVGSEIAHERDEVGVFRLPHLAESDAQASCRVVVADENKRAGDAILCLCSKDGRNQGVVTHESIRGNARLGVGGEGQPPGRALHDWHFVLLVVAATQVNLTECPTYVRKVGGRELIAIDEARHRSHLWPTKRRDVGASAVNHPVQLLMVRTTLIAVVCVRHIEDGGDVEDRLGFLTSDDQADVRERRRVRARRFVGEVKLSNFGAVCQKIDTSAKEITRERD